MYVSIYLSIYLSINPSMYLSIYVSIYLFIYLSIYLSMHDGNYSYIYGWHIPRRDKVTNSGKLGHAGILKIQRIY